MVKTFKGLVIPVKPKEPASDECCMSGCAVCVYDLYDESLQAYHESVVKLKATLTNMGVSEAEWPVGLRSGDEKERKRDNPTMSAFEEMERLLREKKEKERQREREREREKC
ncbi:hypothetical protein VNI00_012312 [Paramarasmius palmivorus]|uniref:Oxidoreductase-like domain-containing protein n=1 Tax=Paramarasmius palmivorus TaxID=297713 RepID=A0AAW0C4K6_9AGAR